MPVESMGRGPLFPGSAHSPGKEARHDSIEDDGGGGRAPARRPARLQRRHPPTVTPDQQRDLNALTRATVAYTDFSRAQAAGYTERLTDCMADSSGGMGFHYGKVPFIDGEARLMEPEILMYEPQADGSLQFVGVEYVVPLSASATPAVPVRARSSTATRPSSSGSCTCGSTRRTPAGCSPTGTRPSRARRRGSHAPLRHRARRPRGRPPQPGAAPGHGRSSPAAS